IGKATALRSRIRSYFAKDIAEVRSPLIQKMVTEAQRLDFKKTDSVLEALLLEADLIKKFQPPYNTQEKDDKSFNCVVITDEDFPRVLVVRKRDIVSNTLKTSNSRLSTFNFQLLTYYGPFPNGNQLKDALKIVRKIFPFRDNKCHPEQGKPCFNRQIGLCPGVCTGEITRKEYALTIHNIQLFFSGKKTSLLKNLKSQMGKLSKKLEFEKANEVKKTVFALSHIQDVSLIKTDKLELSTKNYRVEAYDIAHLSGSNVVGVMTVLINGVPAKAEYRLFKIKGGFGNNDTASLKEIIERRLKHKEWNAPDLVVADGGVAQKSVIESAFKHAGVKVPVVAVTKNERHRPETILGDSALIKSHERSILLANSEAHRFALAFQRKLRKIH
ncbi:MAG: hypothetical protein NUV54_03500, partial [Candidatus Taylorbacteria bacterium]|nr:hypothetical protein [Candidatus Taylorbacteria bacterium]